MAFPFHGLDLSGLATEVRHISPLWVACAVLSIYAGYWLRSLRWAILLRPSRRTRASEVLASQFIGFTAAALFGRVADLARPYLAARQLQTSVTAQLAVYSLERAFDLGAAAILFSLTLLLSPPSTPHHQSFVRAGILSFAGTLLLLLAVLAFRFAGTQVDAAIHRLFRPLPSRLTRTLAGRLTEFRDGLSIVSNARDLLACLALSLVLWGGVALAYYSGAHAFRACPSLATLTVTATMLLLATSLGSSLLQLPVIGWFTQIAALAAALHGFFAVPLATATACATVIFASTNLCIIPAGLIAARVLGISVRSSARAPDGNPAPSPDPKQDESPTLRIS